MVCAEIRFLSFLIFFGKSQHMPIRIGNITNGMAPIARLHLADHFGALLNGAFAGFGGILGEQIKFAARNAVAGSRVGDIGFAVQDYCEKQFGYGVVRELVGHGLGKSLHEDPQIPNFGKRGSGAKLQEGMAIAIEPMVNLGVKEVWYDRDGWTVRTKDGKVSAHYEHNIWVKKGAPDVLSSFEEVEKAEKSNSYLNSSYY